MAALLHGSFWTQHGSNLPVSVLLAPVWFVLHVHGHGPLDGGFSAWSFLVGGWAAHALQFMVHMLSVGRDMGVFCAEPVSAVYDCMPCPVSRCCAARRFCIPSFDDTAYLPHSSCSCMCKFQFQWVALSAAPQLWLVSWAVLRWVAVRCFERGLAATCSGWCVCTSCCAGLSVGAASACHCEGLHCASFEGHCSFAAATEQCMQHPELHSKQLTLLLALWLQALLQPLLLLSQAGYRTVVCYSCC